MTHYIARFDNGNDERFDAINDAAAIDYARELLLDNGAEDGETASVYAVNVGGRGDEEYVGDAEV